MKSRDLIAKAEHAVKSPIWGCQMCGQCVLHDTGLTCPMTCPKTLHASERCAHDAGRFWVMSKVENFLAEQLQPATTREHAEPTVG